MTRSRLVGALCVIAIVAVAVYVASNTYWDDVPIPTPPKGEAISNPFYAAQRFAEALGARTRRDRTLALPPTGAVVVVSAWHWDLSDLRQAAIKDWVEGGGRLVVDRNLTGGLSGFESWSGIEWDVNQKAADKHDEDHDDDTPHERCRPVDEITPASGRRYSVCDLDYFSFLKSTRPAEWALRDAIGEQALRVNIGGGSVTVINTAPFTWQVALRGRSCPPVRGRHPAAAR